MARKKTNGGAKKAKASAGRAAKGAERLYTLDVFIISGPLTRGFVKKNPVLSRTIEMRGGQTLEDLHHAIFDAFGREQEHMYEFQLGGEAPMDPEAKRYVLPGAFELNHEHGRPVAGRVDLTTLGALGLKEGDRFGYWFDFGDDWWHQVNVEAVEEKTPRGKYPRVTGRVGEDPPQYADFEEEGARGGAGPADGTAVPVPAKLGMRLGEIVKATDRFCDRHLDEEFKGPCRDMAAALCLGGLPLAGGKAAGWAAGVVYSVGWVNFLGDPSRPGHMKAEDMAKAVGVSPATLMNRAKVIRERLGLRRMDPRYSTRGMVEGNPLARMVPIGGVPRDIREAPLRVQKEAARRGVIPFVPGEDAGGDEGGAR